MRRPRRAHNRLTRVKKVTPEKRHRRHFAPGTPGYRLTSAIAKAREYKSILRHGDADDLANATLLQGIISGDVISASILTRQKLQRENLRLRQRLAVQKLRESRAQEQLLLIAAQKATRPALTGAQLRDRINEIYGIQPHALHQPPTERQRQLAENNNQPIEAEIIQESPATLPADEPPQSS